MGWYCFDTLKCIVCIICLVTVLLCGSLLNIADDFSSPNWPPEPNPGDITLSELLIMSPFTTVVSVALGMTTSSKIVGEPTNKFTNLLLISLSVALSAVVFVVSLLAAFRTIQWLLIATSALSLLLMLIEIVDISCVLLRIQ